MRRKLLSIVVVLFFSEMMLMAETYVGVPMGIENQKVTKKIKKDILGLTKTILYKDYKMTSSDFYSLNEHKKTDKVFGVQIDGDITKANLQKIQNIFKKKYNKIKTTSKTIDKKEKVLKGNERLLELGYISLDKYNAESLLDKALLVNKTTVYKDKSNYILFKLSTLTKTYQEDVFNDKKQEPKISYSVKIRYLTGVLVDKYLKYEASKKMEEEKKKKEAQKDLSGF